MASLLKTLHVLKYIIPQIINAGSGYARQEWKATLTVAIVVLTFLICWLPFFVLALVRPLAPQVKVPGIN